MIAARNVFPGASATSSPAPGSRRCTSICVWPVPQAKAATNPNQARRAREFVLILLRNHFLDWSNL